jgi:hypothetical protein
MFEQARFMAQFIICHEAFISSSLTYSQTLQQFLCDWHARETSRFVHVVALREQTVCGPGRQLWPDIRVGAMAYLLQGHSTTENKALRIEHIERIERMMSSQKTRTCGYSTRSRYFCLL